jgi:DNA-directed RNA polymerase subunit E'/Rpb7
MTSPYINTYLNTTVRIHPNQMDNNIRKHIKNNIEREHLNKCFLDYGFLQKIHEIYPDYDAEIIAEDPLSCALFKVRMSCSLCRPILNSSIICKTMGITPPIIYLVNGPMDIIVKTSQNINKNIFIFNQRLNRWTAKKEDIIETETDAKKKYIILEEGMYLKVKIINKKIIDKSDRILCIGYLESVPNEKEIQESLNTIQSVQKYSSMKEYLDIETNIQNEQLTKLSEQDLSDEDLTESED